MKMLSESYKHTYISFMRIRLLLVTLRGYEIGWRLRAGHARKSYFATSVPVPSYRDQDSTHHNSMNTRPIEVIRPLGYMIYVAL
jgi:hypothetical protein